MEAALAVAACVLAATVGGIALRRALAHRPTWNRWRRLPAPPPADQPTTATYRSPTAAAYWESETHNFWATHRPNQPNWRRRRNRSA